MATDRQNEDDSRSLVRCATCNATVIAQIDCHEPADANTVCVTCGMTLVDPPFEGGDYFDLIMKSIHALRRGGPDAKRPAYHNLGHRPRGRNRRPMRPAQTTHARCRTTDKTSD